MLAFVLLRFNHKRRPAHEQTLTTSHLTVVILQDEIAVKKTHTHTQMHTHKAKTIGEK